MDLFAGALQDETDLRALYEMPNDIVARKQIDHLDDTFRNVLQTGRAGLLLLLLLLPGRGQALRINGRACVSTEPGLLKQLTPVGKPPRAALVLRAEEVFTHAPRPSSAPGCGTRRPGRTSRPSPPPRRCCAATSATPTSRSSRRWSTP